MLLAVVISHLCANHKQTVDFMHFMHLLHLMHKRGCKSHSRNFRAAASIDAPNESWSADRELLELPESPCSYLHASPIAGVCVFWIVLTCFDTSPEALEAASHQSSFEGLCVSKAATKTLKDILARYRPRTNLMMSLSTTNSKHFPSCRHKMQIIENPHAPLQDLQGYTYYSKTKVWSRCRPPAGNPAGMNAGIPGILLPNSRRFPGTYKQMHCRLHAVQCYFVNDTDAFNFGMFLSL